MDPEETFKEEDYYAYLNVDKLANDEEITNAYRKLSKLYHPDKHTNEELKAEAVLLFNKIKKSYEVLKDPHKRAIYDTLGIKGFETEGWELIHRTKTPQEIREEYERLCREQEERRLQQYTNPKGSIVVTINARDLFDYYDYKGEEDDYYSSPSIEISNIAITQSIEAPLTVKDTATLTATVNAHNGTGSGTMAVSLYKIISPKTVTEVECSFGNGPVMTLKLFRNLSKRSFLNMSGIIQFVPNGIQLGFNSGLVSQLDKHLTAHLTWKEGFQSGLTTMIVNDKPKYHTSASLHVGLPHSYVSTSYTRKIGFNDLKMKAAVKYGTFGIMFEYGVEKKITKHSVLGSSVCIGIPVGVLLKVKLLRGSYVFSFPIYLSDELVPSAILYGTVAPLLVYFTVKRFVVDPHLQAKHKVEAERQKKANAFKIAQKQKEAEAAIKLMTESYSRIVKSEESKNGLIIVKGLYGNLVSFKEKSETFLPAGIIDVTVPLQCLVKDSKLFLHEYSKSQLPGFYDPCLTEAKILKIEYLFHGLTHVISISDLEPLRLPKQSHCTERSSSS